MAKNQPKEITLNDIAKELNISKSTVSRALQNHPAIGKATKEAVLKLAKEYNYQVNAVASSLSKRSTNTIGVIVPLLSHYFFSTVIAGIEDVAYKAGYKVIICQSAESYEREVEVSRTLLSSKVDGLIVSISKETIDVSHLSLFAQKNIPLIFFDRLSPDIETSSVSVDDYQGAFTAVEHLIQQGCKRIAHFAGPPEMLIAKNRLRGYQDALKKYKIPLDNNLIFNCGLQRENGCISAKDMLSNTKLLPDAIFAVCDPVAIGIILTLKENGIKIPKDIAIVGFNDDPSATVIDPPLTTIAQPAFAIGEVAVELFLRQISRKATTSEKKVFPTQLIVRASSLK